MRQIACVLLSSSEGVCLFVCYLALSKTQVPNVTCDHGLLIITDSAFSKLRLPWTLFANVIKKPYKLYLYSNKFGEQFSSVWYFSTLWLLYGFKAFKMPMFPVNRQERGIIRATTSYVDHCFSMRCPPISILQGRMLYRTQFGKQCSCHHYVPNTNVKG